MKIKFILYSLLLIFARGCDFYSTSLWFFQENGMSHETNPLTRFFGVGWSGLVLVNLVLVGLVLLAFYFYSFHYRPKLDQMDSPANYREYISQIYFGRKDRFYQIFYRFPVHKKPMIAHTGYILVRVLIIGSFLAAIHNLGQFYQLEFYHSFREIVHRPLFVIYGIILISLIRITHSLFQKEYQAALKS